MQWDERNLHSLHVVHPKCVFWTHNSDILAKALLSHLDWCGTIVNTCMSHPKHYTQFSVTSEMDFLKKKSMLH